MLKLWNSYDFQSMTRTGLRTETIFYNYDITSQLHDYSFIGNDFREREHYSRIRRNISKKFAVMDPLLRNAILDDLSHSNFQTVTSKL